MNELLLYLLLGALAGAFSGLIGIGLSNDLLQKVFGFALLLISLKMIFLK